MNENENMIYEEKGLDMVELIQMFWKNKIVIISLMVLCTLLMIVKTMYFSEDTYTSSGILYVSNRQSEYNENVAVLKSDIDTSRTLGTTYMEILKTSHFLEEIGSLTGNKYPWRDLSKMISITSVNDTELLRVTTVSENPQDSYDITCTIMERASEKLKSVYKQGEVEIVDPPRLALTPNDKGAARNAILGALVGIALGAIYVFVTGFFDKKVRSSEDLEKRYGISILGEISR